MDLTAPIPASLRVKLAGMFGAAGDEKAIVVTIAGKCAETGPGTPVRAVCSFAIKDYQFRVSLYDPHGLDFAICARSKGQWSSK
jgi:hypothetical protein